MEDKDKTRDQLVQELKEYRQEIKQLQESKDRFRYLFESSPQLVWTCQPDGLCDFLSSQWVKYTGILEAIQLGYGWLEQLHPDDRAPTKMVWENAFNSGSNFQVEFRIRRHDGVYRWFYTQAILQRDLDGKRTKWYGSNTDITERKIAEKRSHEDKERLASIIKGTNIGTWEWNVQTGETVFNDRWAEIIGYTLEEISPISLDTWINFSHPDDFKNSNKVLEKHFQGATDFYEVETRMKHKNGKWIWVLDRGKVIEWTENGKPLLMFGSHQDITTRKYVEDTLAKKNAEVKKIAIRDELTHLYNRRGFFELGHHEIDRAKRFGKPLCAIMFDLDHFKRFNDTYGHALGDLVLEEVARRCSDHFRKVDIIGRYGGEEFAVLLPETHLHDAKKIAERFRHNVGNKPFATKHGLLSVTISLGVAILKDDKTTLENILELADSALYKAKELGRNRVCVIGEDAK